MQDAIHMLAKIANDTYENVPSDLPKSCNKYWKGGRQLVQKMQAEEFYGSSGEISFLKIQAERRTSLINVLEIGRGTVRSAGLLTDGGILNITNTIQEEVNLKEKTFVIAVIMVGSSFTDNNSKECIIANWFFFY